jgi:hypothetical protein
LARGGALAADAVNPLPCCCNPRLDTTADNVSGSHTTSTRYGAASDAAPAQRLLGLAWEHAEELFGQRVAADWHNTWQRQPLGGGGGSQSSGMLGVFKRKARSELVVSVAPIALRAAFSNIQAWTILKADLDLAGKVGGGGLRLRRGGERA